VKRGYQSDRRRTQSEATRRRILDTARELVIENGYQGTKIAELARRAEVHVDTVYELVGRKPVILRELVEEAISGTDGPVDPLERDYVKKIQAESDAGRKLDLYAAAMTAIHRRLAPLFLALRDASRTDPEAADVWTRISERRATNMRMLAAELLATGQIRTGLSTHEIGDALWVMNSPDVHQLLVSERGWSQAHYRDWLADTWRRLLLTRTS
jgi:AcrR family transcriptional regulator